MSCLSSARILVGTGPSCRCSPALPTTEHALALRAGMMVL